VDRDVFTLAGQQDEGIRGQTSARESLILSILECASRERVGNETLLLASEYAYYLEKGGARGSSLSERVFSQLLGVATSGTSPGHDLRDLLERARRLDDLAGSGTSATERMIAALTSCEPCSIDRLVRVFDAAVELETERGGDFQLSERVLEAMMQRSALRSICPSVGFNAAERLDSLRGGGSKRVRRVYSAILDWASTSTKYSRPSTLRANSITAC
jgi:hypothetical protein